MRVTGREADVVSCGLAGPSGGGVGKPPLWWIASSRVRSPSVRRSAPAAMLSARWAGSDVPGMTSTCGPRCRAHARRTCAGVAWCSRATARTCSGSAPLGRPRDRLRRWRKTGRTPRPARRRCAGAGLARGGGRGRRSSARIPLARSAGPGLGAQGGRWIPRGGGSGRRRAARPARRSARRSSPARTGAGLPGPGSRGRAGAGSPRPARAAGAGGLVQPLAGRVPARANLGGDDQVVGVGDQRGVDQLVGRT